MAKENKAQTNLKTTRRLTPYDAKKGNSLDLPAAAPKEQPRKPTREETRGNNLAPVEQGRMMGQLLRLKPLFELNLLEMNAGKVGRPYEYSDLLILWMCMIVAESARGHRWAVGYIESILQCVGIKGPSYSRFHERATDAIVRLLMEPDPELRARYGSHVYAIFVSDNVVDRERRAGIDSSGMTLSTPNKWRKKKWKTECKDLGWVKLHALIDVDSGEMLACAITDETVGDTPLLRPLVSEARGRGHRISVVFADGAYSDDANWKYLSDSGIHFVTSFKVNTSPKSNGCMARGQAAALWCSLPYDEWTRVSGYGTRWKCEVGFSSFKRMFHEVLSARSVRGIIREMGARILVFNDYKRIRAMIIGTTGNGVRIG